MLGHGLARWHEAKAYCESLGGHLAVIGSAQENEAVFALAAKGLRDAWIGLARQGTQETLSWVAAGGSDYAAWACEAPSDGGYAAISRSSGMWNALGYASENAFVCE